MKRTVASRSIGRGLAKVEPTVADTLVGFATEAGLLAADGDAANSPFTSALINHLGTPGLDLRLAFGRVRDDVIRNTDGKQRPFVYGSLGGSTVAIVEAAADPAPVPPTARTSPTDSCWAAETHWKSAEAIGTAGRPSKALSCLPVRRSCSGEDRGAAKTGGLAATVRVSQYRAVSLSRRP
jgi:hypothetical protein